MTEGRGQESGDKTEILECTQVVIGTGVGSKTGYMVIVEAKAADVLSGQAAPAKRCAYHQAALLSRPGRILLARLKRIESRKVEKQENEDRFSTVDFIDTFEGTTPTPEKQRGESRTTARRRRES
ncbi:hypothetical protein PRK78_002162 [Emydomyces testavorans]|uniref:Uncharacterized protein n=1 Tax=Emydomyces testavorans TaxID=2070801 RepID=A0AAF0IHC6_9EURO|nr:hypothetical protein PRK78_002162 [Emydomyces testavorans]